MVEPGGDDRQPRGAGRRGGDRRPPRRRRGGQGGRRVPGGLPRGRPLPVLGRATPKPSTTSTWSGPATCWRRPAEPGSSGSSTPRRSGPSASGAPPPGPRWTRRPTPGSTICSAGTSSRSTWPSTRCCGPPPRDCPVVLVQPTTPVGPGDRAPTPTGRTVLEFLNGRFPAYVDTTLNIVDVDDVAHGHLLAAERGSIGRSYILGGENLSLQQILASLAGATGLSAPDPAGPELAGAWWRPPSPTSSRADSCTASRRSPSKRPGCPPPRCPSTTARARGELGYASRPASAALARAGPLVRRRRLRAAGPASPVPLGGLNAHRDRRRAPACSGLMGGAPEPISYRADAVLAGDRTGQVFRPGEVEVAGDTITYVGPPRQAADLVGAAPAREVTAPGAPAPRIRQRPLPLADDPVPRDRGEPARCSAGSRRCSGPGRRD